MSQKRKYEDNKQNDDNISEKKYKPSICDIDKSVKPLIHKIKFSKPYNSEINFSKYVVPNNVHEIYTNAIIKQFTNRKLNDSLNDSILKVVTDTQDMKSLIDMCKDIPLYDIIPKITTNLINDKTTKIQGLHRCVEQILYKCVSDIKNSLYKKYPKDMSILKSITDKMYKVISKEVSNYIYNINNKFVENNKKFNNTTILRDFYYQDCIKKLYSFIGPCKKFTRMKDLVDDLDICISPSFSSFYKSIIKKRLSTDNDNLVEFVVTSWRKSQKNLKVHEYSKALLLHIVSKHYQSFK